MKFDKWADLYLVETGKIAEGEERIVWQDEHSP